MRTCFISGLGIGQICSWGSIYYSFPLIAQAMGVELGWSKMQLYSAATAGLVLAGLAAYPVGKAIDRGHGRVIMVSASVLAGLLMLAWSQVNNFAVFVVLASLVGGLQAATLYEPAFAVIAWREGPANARKGITALTLWGGFASTVFVPLTQYLIDGYGWRGALMALAAVNIAICGGVYRTAIRGPAAPVPRAAGSDEKNVDHRGAVQQALRMPVFWALAIAILAYSATFSAFTFHLYPMLLERGMTASDVVIAMTVIGPAQVAGRIAVSAFAAHRSVKALGVVVVSIFPIAIGALIFLPATFAVVLGVLLLYGAANGIFTIVRGMAVPEMVSSTDYGAINGALTGPATIARAVAPLGAAAVWGWGNSYSPVLAATVAGALVLAASFWTAALLSNSHARRKATAESLTPNAGISK